MTTKQDIRSWLDRREPENTHMIVATDTFDWEDYPVFCSGNVKERISHYQNASMSKVMEVYNLSMDLEEQLNEHRAWHV